MFVTVVAFQALLEKYPLGQEPLLTKEPLQHKQVCVPLDISDDGYAFLYMRLL